MSSKATEQAYVIFRLGLTEISAWVLKKFDVKALLHLANFLSIEPKDSEHTWSRKYMGVL